MGIGSWSKSLKTVDQTMIIIKEYSLGEGGERNTSTPQACFISA